MSKISIALHWAQKLHADQKDKAGAPYIDHVLRVALAQADETHTIVALLHDTVEDTECQLGVIREAFGYDVAMAVDAITKRDGETNHDYLNRVCSNEIASAVKLADIRDNSDPRRLNMLPNDVKARLAKKYEKSLAAIEAACQ